MSDKIFIGSDVADLDVGQEKNITKVILSRSADTWFEAGDDTGDTLEVTNPWATQAMADVILAEVKRTAYLPYTATDALLDPAAEIGDSVTVGGVYSEIVSMDLDLGVAGCVGLSAPGVDEIEDEYPYKSSGDREAQRENKRLYSLITKTDEEIRLYVANEIEGLEAEFSVTAGEIRSYVDDQINGVNSTISQTASQITAYVNDEINGVSSEISQTASSLTAKINSVDGRVTSLSADLNGIEASVTGLEGDYSSLSIRLGSIESTVSDVEGNLSTVRQTVNGLEITTSGLEDSVDGLGNGTTVISGYCIQTGKISAEYLEVGDLVASRIGSGYVDLLDSSDSVVGTMSIRSSSSAISGQGVNISAPAVGLNATSGDVFLSSRGDATYLHVNTDNVVCKGGFVPTGSGAWNLGGSRNKWANVYATNGTIQTSDRNQKTDIAYGLGQYDTLFDGLQPCSYKMLDGGKRTHLGMISQDVEETMQATGVSDMDFAGFIKSPDGNGGYDYALRYSEFIPLLVDQVQKLKARVAGLEETT